MQLLALPAFADNYLWLLHHHGKALVVDPGDAAVVQSALQQWQLELTHTLLTHHHADHTGGVMALRQAWPNVQVIGPAHERIDGVDLRVEGGQTTHALGQAWQVLDVAGHTAGHVAYFHPALPLAGRDPSGRPLGQSQPLVFCGDAMFSAGCGRLFEGTAAQLHDSLARLSALPDDTLVCCTHEYTLSNLRFALHIEPDNRSLLEHREWANSQRNQGLPTLPSTIAIERGINPFLRTGLDQVQAAARLAPGFEALEQQWANRGASVQTFAALRQWKNVF